MGSSGFYGAEAIKTYQASLLLGEPRRQGCLLFRGAAFRLIHRFHRTKRGAGCWILKNFYHFSQSDDMRPNQINSLAALREERIHLKIRMAATRQELLRSLGETATLGRQLLFQKVLIPAGAAGLLAAAARKIFSTSNIAATVAPEDVAPGIWRRLFHLLLAGTPFVERYLFSDETDDVEDMES